MEYFIIAIVSLLAAALTLFSGFGLGTILMPVFAIFFPLDIAVAATATVHLSNNIFKLALIGKKAVPSVVARFAIPAAIFSFFGATLLLRISHLPPLFEYGLVGHECLVSTAGLTISLLIIGFAILELIPATSELSFSKKVLPLGGALSGFFGGLSGHQGALRSAFLIRLGMSKEAFIGTGVVSAVIVDVTRLSVYGTGHLFQIFSGTSGDRITGLVITGILTAFLGSFVGSKLIKKVTMRNMQIVVGTMLLILGAILGAGII